jgi:hypothetical protein
MIINFFLFLPLKNDKTEIIENWISNFKFNLFFNLKENIL